MCSKIKIFEGVLYMALTKTVIMICLFFFGCMSIQEKWGVVNKTSLDEINKFTDDNKDNKEFEIVESSVNFAIDKILFEKGNLKSSLELNEFIKKARTMEYQNIAKKQCDELLFQKVNIKSALELKEFIERSYTDEYKEKAGKITDELLFQKVNLKSPTELKNFISKAYTSEYQSKSKELIKEILLNDNFSFCNIFKIIEKELVVLIHSDKDTKIQKNEKDRLRKIKILKILNNMKGNKIEFKSLTLSSIEEEKILNSYGERKLKDEETLMEYQLSGGNFSGLFFQAMALESKLKACEECWFSTGLYLSYFEINISELSKNTYLENDKIEITPEILKFKDIKITKIIKSRNEALQFENQKSYNINGFINDIICNSEGKLERIILK